MKEAFWTYLLIALGIFIFVVLLLVQDLTSTDEEDYYLTKEVMEASMIDAIDYGVYRQYGDIRMVKEKFYESFIRRYSESVKGIKTYKIEFYDVYEYPPKATVRIKTSTNEYTVKTDSAVDFDIVTVLSGILESKYKESAFGGPAYQPGVSSN